VAYARAAEDDGMVVDFANQLYGVGDGFGLGFRNCDAGSDEFGWFDGDDVGMQISDGCAYGRVARADAADEVFLACEFHDGVDVGEFQLAFGVVDECAAYTCFLDGVDEDLSGEGT